MIARSAMAPGMSRKGRGNLYEWQVGPTRNSDEACRGLLADRGRTGTVSKAGSG